MLKIGRSARSIAFLTSLPNLRTKWRHESKLNITVLCPLHSFIKSAVFLG